MAWPSPWETWQKTLIETQLTAQQREAIFDMVWQTINEEYYDCNNMKD